MASSVDPTTIGAFVTIILAFLGVAKIMLNQATKDREADRQERLRLANAIEKMADPTVNGNQQIADGITRQAEESAERNGHLGELIIQQGEQTQKIADMAVDKIVSQVSVQNVEHQHIKDSVVEKEIIKSKE